MSILERINNWILPIPESVLKDGLETPKSYRERWTSIRVIYFTMFLMSLGFSIILTGVWPYLDKLDPTAGKEFMGYVIAANPFAQMLFSPLFGWWGNKLGSIRLPLLASLALFCIASGIYSSLEIFTEHRKYWMLISRLLVGVGASNTAVCRSYLSSATRLSERTSAVSMISLAQVLGFIIGPALQTAVVPLGNDGHQIGAFRLDMYTAAGWMNVILGILNLIMVLPFIFKERPIAAKEAMIKHGMESEKSAWKAIKPNYLAAWTLIIAFFVLVFNFMLLETLGTSLTMDQFAWTKSEALYYMGVLMSVGAIVACLTFVAINPICKFFAERKVMIWGGFAFMVIGRALYIPWGETPPLVYDDSVKNNSDLMDILKTQCENVTLLNQYFDNSTINDCQLVGCPSSQTWCSSTNAMTISQFIIGYALTAVGYPIGVTLIQTIFSKILGPRPQGVWMGLMTGSGCFSRVLGPVFVTYVYTELGTIWTFGMTTFMMTFAMVWLLLMEKKLVPVEEHLTTNGFANATELQEMNKKENQLQSCEMLNVT